MFVRPITFVDYLEIPDIKTEYSANLFLYDVDNDNDIELLVGNWDSGDLQNNGEADVEHRPGELNIIKYGSAWRKARVNGIVSCISAGDITGADFPDVLVLCSNYTCYFYNISCEKTESGEWDRDSCQLQLTYEQMIAPNAKNIVIKDIDNDGKNEVIVGFTDRAVRLYKWIPDHLSANEGYLVETTRWDLCSQIGGLTIHYTSENEIQILASLTGGIYAVLFWQSKPDETGEAKCLPYVKYHTTSDEYKDPLNADVRSEIIGNIRRCNVENSPHNCDQSRISKSNSDKKSLQQPPYVAVCTIDGQLMLLDDSEKIWQVQLGRGELFGLSKVDITKNDAEEVVICSWEGVTYIINHHKEVARFYPKHQCQAFLSGNYAVAPSANQPVLIYSTFDNSLVIYYNLNLDRIPARSLVQDLSAAIKNQCRKIGVDVSNNQQTAKFISNILYKWPITNRISDTTDFFDPDSLR